jgi:mitogen-activated protein kinase organizer 1
MVEANQCIIDADVSQHNPLFPLRRSPDNSTFVSCGADKVLIYWDVSTGQPIRKLRGHSARINCVRLNADASLAVTGSYDSTVKCWDLKANT